MNEKYLQQAAEKYADTRVLINGVSKRSTQLARGAHPLIELTPGHKLEYIDIALLEVIEDKLSITSASLERQENWMKS
ncbi:MAG: DNA-directed RNA polymerase subunit omega [Lentisphaeria bacterium]